MIAYFAASWKEWLDDEAHASFAKHGYYIASFKTRDGTVSDKVKVIGLNTQACYTMNFYLMSERNDPGDHLAWLDTELSLMQQLGQVAIMIGHVPPGDDTCTSEWASRLRVL